MSSDGICSKEQRYGAPSVVIASPGRQRHAGERTVAAPTAPSPDGIEHQFSPRSFDRLNHPNHLIDGACRECCRLSQGATKSLMVTM
jgi:hypothetical protein